MLPLSATDSIFGLPVALMDGLIGAVLGGLLTVIGGFLATRWQAKQEEGRAQQQREDELIAAIRIVRYELAADAASLASFLKYAQLPQALTDTSFRSVQLVIARRLNPKLRVEVVNAFNMLQIGVDAATNLGRIAIDDWPHEQRETIESVVKDLDRAGLALRNHLVNDLKVSEV